MIQALLIGILGFLAPLDYAVGTSYLHRPIVLGPIVGLILGDVRQGLIMGATLELFFMGAVSVGAYVPPDSMVGGILGTAFAITMGQDIGVAITLAMPIALLSLAFGNLVDVVAPMVARLGDRYAAKGRSGGITAAMWGIGFMNCARRGILCFFGFLLGSTQMERLLSMIPQVVIDGLGVAANIMPAIGFAVLAQMIMTRKVAPFFFLGFLLSAYFGVPVLGIAALGLILVIVMMDFKPQQQAAAAGEVDDDDF